MEKPDFKELHPDAPATQVGPDLASLVAADVAAPDGFVAGGGAQSDVQSVASKLSSFSVYWNVGDKHFSVFEPKVISPSGVEIQVQEPQAYSRGTYVCDIRHSKARNETTAEIKLDSAVVRDPETVKVVKLFRIQDGEVEQYHTGVITLTDVTLIGEEGEEYGSQPEEIAGKVHFTGAEGSGLKTSTYRNQNGEAFAVVDVERPNEETQGKDFGLHRLTIRGSSGEDQVFWVFSDSDVDVSRGVDSLNGKTGKLNLIGGKKIRVESVSERTIRVTLDETKEDEDPDPDGPKTDPCVHPGDDPGGNGGVKPSDDTGGGTGGGGGGGVGPDGRGEPHIGDNGCQGRGCP